MSSSRLLILGVLRSRQPTHGYEIRRELELWGAEKWANIAYGSIYHALNQMSKEELITPVVHHDADRVGNRPSKTSYALTERGEKEFQFLLREQWREVQPIRDPFQVALTFMDQLPRDELVATLKYRAAQIRLNLEANEWITRVKSTPQEAPRHIVENMRLSEAHARAELEWTEDVIVKVERGELP